MSSRLLSVVRTTEQLAAVRAVHTKPRPLGVVPVHPRYKRFQEQQVFHLERRHLPPWQHKQSDLILFYGTMVLGFVGLLAAASGFRSLILGKKH